MTLNTITLADVKEINEKITKALKEIGTVYGIEIKAKHTTYNEL